MQQLIKEGYATINGKPGKPAYRIEGEDEITVQLVDHIVAPNNDAATLPETLPLDVIYEDDDMAAIDKPAGMVVHPAAGHATGTLVNALLARWPQVAQVGGEGRAGIEGITSGRDASGAIGAAAGAAVTGAIVPGPTMLAGATAHGLSGPLGTAAGGGTVGRGTNT